MVRKEGANKTGNFKEWSLRDLKNVAECVESVEKNCRKSNSDHYWFTTLWLRNFLIEMALPTKPSAHPKATTMP